MHSAGLHGLAECSSSVKAVHRLLEKGRCTGVVVGEQGTVPEVEQADTLLVIIGLAKTFEDT